MDDLLALWNEAPSPSHDEEERCETGDDKAASSAETASTEDRPRSANKICALSVDDRVGIRMINRKLAGADLLDLITDHPYHSPAQLSAYSLANLNGILVDPATVVDMATVSGRTAMVTVGLVFSNSGTRVSNAGHAYCALTLGNFTTGAAISVLLFGSAYRKHCSTSRGGTVAALVNPNLIPSKDGKGTSATSVTFTVNNEEQFIHVADARDYACCKAMTRAQNGNGHWVQDGKRCKNFVDTRVSEYCEKHRKNEKAQTANGISTTIMQQLSLQQLPASNAGNRILTLPTQKTVQPPQSRFDGSHSVNWMAQLQSSVPKTNGRNLVNNSLLNPQSNRTPRAATNQGQNSAGALTFGNSTTQTSCTSRTLPAAVNPYAQRSTKPHVMIKQTTTATPLHPSSKSTSHIVTGDIFKRTKPSQRGVSGKMQPDTKKRRVNTDTDGFNGSVPIPKTSTMFSQTKQPIFQLQTSKPAVKGRSEAEVRSRQKLLAEQLRERKATAEGALQNKMTVKKRPKNGTQSHSTKTATTTTTSRDTLFGSVGDQEVAATISAKSRFAFEAAAEEYARSRRVVTELEQEESRKENKGGQSSREANDAGSSSIQKEWHCQTCKRSFNTLPARCLRLKHRVKVDRKIRAEQSIAEGRLALSGKKAEDGGLVLGAGLDWSRWKRFS